VLDKVSVRTEIQRYQVNYPTFYFHDPDGDVVEVHRTILSSEPSDMKINPVSRFRIDAEQQKQGAVWVGGWRCGPNPSKATVRAYLTDSHGNNSNALDYTVVCPGSSALPQ
jgi:hypothetical protein